MGRKQKRLTLALGLSALHKAGNISFNRSFSFFGLTTGSPPADMIKRQKDSEIKQICLCKIYSFHIKHKPNEYLPLLVDALVGGRIV